MPGSGIDPIHMMLISFVLLCFTEYLMWLHRRPPGLQVTPPAAPQAIPLAPVQADLPILQPVEQPEPELVTRPVMRVLRGNRLWDWELVLGQRPNGSWAILDLRDSLAASPERSNLPQRGRRRHSSGSGTGPSANGA